MFLDQADPDVSRQAMHLDTIGGFDRIFVDQLRQAGRREQRRRLIDSLKPDDVVYAASADRFCSHLRDFLQCRQAIQDAGAELVLLDENLDSRSASGRQMIKILQAFDRLDFRYQSDRKKAGIRQARAAGRRIGRPPVSIPPGFRDICRAWAEGCINGREAAQRSGLRHTSFYKKAAELGFAVPKRRRPEADRS
jgi:DNA invertase Pin-like site-specific DNA recombinase